MNVVELFGCSGGMAEGARRAGVEISLAVDWSADACGPRSSAGGRESETDGAYRRRLRHAVHRREAMALAGRMWLTDEDRRA